MSHVHNTLLRGLNAIYLQAPHVRSPTDTSDFLFFCAAWVKTVEHHHDTEERVLFPAIEDFTKKPGLMEGNHQQHEAFTPGLNRFLQYAQNTTPENYNSETLKGIVDSFTSPLVMHLVDEIDTLLGLEGYDSAELMKLWLVTENVAKGAAHPNQFDEIIPCVLGCADKTYEGGNPFPPLPFFVPYLVHYWFARKHKGPGGSVLAICGDSHVSYASYHDEGSIEGNVCRSKIAIEKWIAGLLNWVVRKLNQAPMTSSLK